MKQHDYDISKAILKQIRESKENNIKEDNSDAIPITNNPKFGQNVLQNQIDNFRKTVNGGAKFADENDKDAESNPLVFYPKTGNLVFSGSIPSMSDLKFQFSLNDVTNAPYIFVDGLAITDEVLTIIQKIRGYFLNWKEEFQAATDLLDRLKKDYNKKD